MPSRHSSLVQVQLGRVLKYGGAVRLSQVVESISHVVHSVSTTTVLPHTSLPDLCNGPQKAGSCSQFLSFLQTNSRQLLHVSEEVRTFHVLAGCSRDFLVPGDFQHTVVSVIWGQMG